MGYYVSVSIEANTMLVGDRARGRWAAAFASGLLVSALGNPNYSNRGNGRAPGSNATLRNVV